MVFNKDILNTRPLENSATKFDQHKVSNATKVYISSPRQAISVKQIEKQTVAANTVLIQLNLRQHFQLVHSNISERSLTVRQRERKNRSEKEGTNSQSSEDLTNLRKTKTKIVK